jgi:hypothetical protein
MSDKFAVLLEVFRKSLSAIKQHCYKPAKPGTKVRFLTETHAYIISNSV